MPDHQGAEATSRRWPIIAIGSGCIALAAIAFAVGVLVQRGADKPDERAAQVATGAATSSTSSVTVPTSTTTSTTTTLLPVTTEAVSPSTDPPTSEAFPVEPPPMPDQGGDAEDVGEVAVPCPTGQLTVAFTFWTTTESLEAGQVILHTTHGSARLTNGTGKEIGSVQASIEGSSDLGDQGNPYRSQDYWSMGYFKHLAADQTAVVDLSGGGSHQNPPQMRIDLASADGYASFSDYDLSGCEVPIKFTSSGA